MKIYFAGSVTGGRDGVVVYAKLINHLKINNEVLTEHLGNSNLSSYGENNLSPDAIYQRDVDWIKECDVLIAEVTQVSLGVGYEIAYAESLGKKIICLYRPQSDRRLSAMISGNKKFTIRNYKTVDEAIRQIDILLK